MNELAVITGAIMLILLFIGIIVAFFVWKERKRKKVRETNYWEKNKRGKLKNGGKI